MVHSKGKGPNQTVRSEKNSPIVGFGQRDNVQTGGSDRKASSPTGGSGRKVNSQVGIVDRDYTLRTTIEIATPVYTESGSPAIGATAEPPKEPRRHKRRHRKKRAPMQFDRCCHPKKHCIEFPEPRVLGQS